MGSQNTPSEVMNSASTLLNNQMQRLNGNIESANSKLDHLNANIIKASESAEKLSRALNWLTFWGVVVAAVGVGVAVVELVHRWNSPGG